MTTLKRVLVVEDNELVSEVLKALLDERYEVVCASAIAHALAEIAAQPIDAVVLDYYLRDGNGTLVAECAERAGVPIIWMTGDLAAIDALTAQRHAVLTKPFHCRELLEALAKAMREETALVALDAH